MARVLVGEGHQPHSFFCRGSASPVALLPLLVSHMWVSGNDSIDPSAKMVHAVDFGSYPSGQIE
jgi:hypothetical protein